MTGLASRWTRPSRSRVCSVWASIFSLTRPIARRSSLKRYGRSRSWMRMSVPQRLVTCSRTRRCGHIASSLVFHLAPALVTSIPVPYFKVGTSRRLVHLLRLAANPPFTKELFSDMSIVVTGATGNLGRFVIEGLLEKVPADQITAVVRDEAKAAG